MFTLEDAIVLATEAHKGQVDKVGEPYILHPIRVMLSMNSPMERMVAVLHDVVEDTKVTIAKLRKMGVPDVVLDALVAITKVRGEAYRAYLLRVAANFIAAQVKRADISDNSSPIRLYKLPPEKRIELREKYSTALNILDSVEGK